jgi:exodeoxyribonuclease VII large subunit
LRDVLTTLRRRVPHIQVILYPTLVQGEGAGAKIAQAIATAAAREECDVLLVCRGGGSIEDLWAFNEEIVARTIANCPMPVIAGIGHETDFTIADFAADMRAATPTAAAELAATPRADWISALETATPHAKSNAQTNRDPESDAGLAVTPPAEPGGSDCVKTTAITALPANSALQQRNSAAAFAPCTGTTGHATEKPAP